MQRVWLCGLRGGRLLGVRDIKADIRHESGACHLNL